MNLAELQEEWKKDCVIDEQDLAKTSAQSPMLHSKYINELIQYKLKYSKLELDIAQLKAKKIKYFKGEMTKEELQEAGWEQWQYRTLKSDISDLLEADKDIQVLIARQDYIKTVVYFLESIQGEIKSRSFTVRNMIEWHKFRSGA